MSSQDALDVAYSLWEGLDTPRSLACYMLAEAGEFDQLVTLRAEPSHYNVALDYWRDNQATDFLRKADFLPVKVDRRAAALEAWWLAEQQCCKTNARFSVLINNGPAEDLPDERVISYLETTRKEIRRVMGPVPDTLRGAFGPGATFSDRGGLTTLPDKLSSRPTWTPGAACLRPLWEETAWARELRKSFPGRVDPSQVSGNRFTAVPKTALTDRGICIEPSINLYYQLGVGKHLRARLLRAGIDLENGQAVHVQVAREASLSGRYATIDLSSASDTVARELVRYLVSPDWWTLLESLRSPVTHGIKERGIHLQKFSSMGNGFTFELETLIFLCLIRALDPHRLTPGENLWVYGDDIIVPTERGLDVLGALRYCGFTPNSSKTHIQGVFRESCGGDFFLGEPVRAHYLKETPNAPTDYISLANGLRRTGLNCPVRSVLVRRAWFRAQDFIPGHLRKCRGPASLGDLVIHDELHRGRVKVVRSVRWFWAVKPIIQKIPLSKWDPWTEFAAVLYSGRGDVTPRRGGRDVVLGYRLGWVAYS